MSDRRSTDRRATETDRRQGADRRRGGEGRRLVMHLGRSELHVGLIVLDGDGSPDLLRTAKVRWREEGPGLPSDDAAAALRTHLKELVAEERLAGAPTTLIVNGDLCVTRAAAGASTEVRRTLEEIDDRSQMYLALGAGQKVTAASYKSIDARHEQAVVSIARKSSIDALIDVFDTAGLELRRIESEAVSLARAHGALHADDQEPVLLVLCEDGRFEIVVAHQGSLLLEYRPTGGGEGATLTEVLQRHHARLERFSQRQLADYRVTLRKVYLAGQTDQVQESFAELTDDRTFDVNVIDAASAAESWPRPPESLQADQAVMLGRLLREINTAPDSPSPNLIEQWIAESRKHIRPMLIRSAAPLAAVLLLAVGVGLLNMRATSRVAVLDRQLAELAPGETEHHAIRLRLIAGEDKLRRLQTLESGVEHRSIQQLIATVGGCLPDDVWLSRVSVADANQGQLAGSSYTESGVYDFVRHLNQAPAFNQVALEGTGSGHTRQGPATTFELKFRADEAPRAPAGDKK